MAFRFSNAMDTFFAIQESMEEAHKSGYFENGFSNGGLYPSVDVFEENDNTVLTAEIPGTQKEDIKLEIKDKTIRMFGERKVAYPDNASIRRLERKNVKFDRTIKLGSKVEAEKATAEYKNGVLMITLPKAESEKAKQVFIS